MFKNILFFVLLLTLISKIFFAPKQEIVENFTVKPIEVVKVEEDKLILLSYEIVQDPIRYVIATYRKGNKIITTTVEYSEFIKQLN